MEGLQIPDSVPPKSRARLIDRRLLAGGPAMLQLPYTCAVAILGCGMLASLIGTLLSPSGIPDADWLAASAWLIGNASTGLVLAAVAARWLGVRAATLAGMIQVTSLHVFSWPEWQDGAAGSLVSLAACIAIGAFASAEVPGRLAAADRRVSFGFLCAAVVPAALVAGVAGPACILAVCLVYLALFQDGAGLQFFTTRHGVVILTILIAVASVVPMLLGIPDRNAQWGMETLRAKLPIAEPVEFLAALRWEGARCLPWTPWVLVATGVGLRQGYYAPPLGRLLLSWLMTPWMLWAAGVMPPRLAFAIHAPCAALLAAIGVVVSFAWWRGRFTKQASTAIPSRRAGSPPA